MIEREKAPLLLVISAPSGAGKTTLCHSLIGEFEFITYSVSCTTRSPRPSEVDGKSYYFLTNADFERKIQEGAFLEYARVYDYWYGTLRETVLEGMRAGKDVLMDLDVQGATQIRENVSKLPVNDPLRRGHVDIFIAPPSMEILSDRLRGRGQDAPDVIEHRLRQARDEVACWEEYQYMIVNDRLDESYDALRSIVLSEHQRVR